MEEVKRFWPILGLLCSGGLAFSQVVCVGTPKQCQETQKKVCSSEKAEANLDLAGAKRVQGVIKDATDAPFSFSGGHFQVQLRDVASSEVLQQTALDSEGRFTFTNLHSESLRLIVVRLVAGADIVGYKFTKPEWCARL